MTDKIDKLDLAREHWPKLPQTANTALFERHCLTTITV